MASEAPGMFGAAVDSRDDVRFANFCQVLMKCGDLRDSRDSLVAN